MTLPGNLAISLNPRFEYSFVKVPNGEIYVLATDLIPSVIAAAKIESYEVLGTIMGSELEYVTTQHPLMDRESLVIVGDHVTLEAGTGCVHTAPGFGAEDFVVCQKYPEIPMIVPVDSKGMTTADAGKYAGMFYEDTNAVILHDLTENNALLAVETIEHSYPHCWRCKKPIIFRATEQWFCSVDAMKDKAVEACHGVKWIPAWGEDRMTSMIQERSDWCISRQRTWGVPIPIFFCKKCKKPLINDDTISAVAALFREKGTSAWFDTDAADILPAGTKCECGCSEFTKETDTMDVWFDSGSSHAAVLEERDELAYPADLYLEGNDQYRGWFQSSMLTSIATKGVSPYKTVITHGMIVDEERQKMSKSKGNGMSPQEITQQYGADILRLWVSSSDYRADMKISKKMFKQLSQNYLKIRNTARYIMGNLNGFTLDQMVPYDQMLELDKWALMKCNELVGRVRAAYDSYEFHGVIHAIHNFCVVDMSNFYLDVIKDRLYCDDGLSRLSAQTAIYRILDSLVRMLAPVLCFTADEIWHAMPHAAGDDERNVVLNDMPEYDSALTFTDAEAIKWEKIIAVRDDVNKALEQARGSKLIGKPLEAKVTITASENAKEFLDGCGQDLAKLFIVSAVEVQTGEGEGDSYEALGGVKIAVSHMEGEKCERCWIYDPTVGSNAEHPTLCARCASVLGNK